MYTQTCGDGNKHWYGPGKMCACGHVPNDLLAAASCDCGSRSSGVHEPECRAVRWAKERNAWVAAHSAGVEPPLGKVPERKVHSD